MQLPLRCVEARTQLAVPANRKMARLVDAKETSVGDEITVLFGLDYMAVENPLNNQEHK